ncbi:flavanone 3-dioxygenase 3-like [Lycium barbarum]|uniref:flavanone 3-dioxygenase 3-like n=1 Tax=Lycium barbarum TaxID=112863 RepID=UPI00293F32AD|nr:flavanone 3-dioxygenase 3-like [Lycium barbarum]
MADFAKNNLICRFGVPESIIKDNGANQNSHLMKDISEQFKITYRNSTAYRPQMNGAVEAVNKNIKRILRKMVENYKNWTADTPPTSLPTIKQKARAQTEERDRKDHSRNSLPKGSVDPRPESAAEPTTSAPEFNSTGASRALAAAAAAKRKRPSDKGQKSKRRARRVTRTLRDETEADIIVRRVDADAPMAPIPKEAVAVPPLLSASAGLLVPVVNHGIPQSVMKDALDAASEFFDVPNEEKKILFSTNVHAPVRYGTSMNQSKDKVYFWRDFLKHYSNPIASFIDMWPSNPTTYRIKMGNYAKAVQKLYQQLMKVVCDGLGLAPDYLDEEIAQGSQVAAINCYPACPEPDLTHGLPPHTYFGLLSIILQNHEGLQIMDKNEKWHSVPLIKGALIVHLGDQMEVLSNGRYKSVVHRATVNTEKQRLSIASIHSLALNKKIGPAPELVDEKHVLSYRQGSFSDFLDHITGEDITQKKYIDKLKIKSMNILVWSHAEDKSISGKKYR